MTLYEMHSPRPPAPSARDTAAQRFEWPSFAKIARERHVAANTDANSLPASAQEKIPAHVEYLSATHALVWSPVSLESENVANTVKRLLSRGLTVSLSPQKKAA